MKVNYRFILLCIILLCAASANAADNVLSSSSSQTVTGQTYSSSTQDQSAVTATAETLTITKSTISSSATTSSTDNASFYGLNAVVLAKPSSTSNASSATIKSSNNTIFNTAASKGANCVFSYGNGVIYTESDNISSAGGNSRCIMASGGGIVYVTNDTASSTNGSSSVIATDKGGGTITVNGGVYTANGSNSAAIYSTGAISASDATLISNGGEALVLEGANSIVVNNCDIHSNYNKWGALLYQSFSGDAITGSDASLTISGGTFTYTGTKGGMFYCTNNQDTLNLKNVTLVNSCDTLVAAKKGGWGNNATASYGGIVLLNASGQSMKGLIYADANSKIYTTLANSSVFTGSLNPSNVAGLVTMTMDASSSWTLTANSYVNGAVSNPDINTSDNTQTIANITGNGYNVYYSTSANSSLNGKTYPLTNGGYLTPITSGIYDAVEGGSLVISPNPFSEEIKTEYTLKEDSKVTVELFSLSGEKIVENTKTQNAGSEGISVDSLKNLSSGTYLFRISIRNSAGVSVLTKKLIKK